jgi:putative DNA primase/helicase
VTEKVAELDALRAKRERMNYSEPGSNGRATFIPRKLALALAAETPVAVGGEALHTFEHGVYRPDGEERLRARIAAALENEWRRNKADEVIGYLRDASPRLWEAPPLDRINVGNGILDLDSGRLEEHDPAFLSPIQLGAAYDPAAACPAIDRFHAEVLPDDCLELIREIAAYLITPDNRWQSAIMLTGGGGGGKSTEIGLLTALLGPENVSTQPLHKLDEGRFAVADLYGKLANAFADLDAHSLKSSSIFKSITGGDRLTGERKFRPTFTFQPYARLLFSANSPPPTSDSSEAFFRRWLVLPYERSFHRSARRDPNLLGKLTAPAELSGLLNHAIAALPGVRERGFSAAASTEQAAGRFRLDTDPVAAFLEERCERHPDRDVAKPHLFAAFRAWCEDNNRKPFSAQRFHPRVRELVPDLDTHEPKREGIYYYLGLSLNGSGESHGTVRDATGQKGQSQLTFPAVREET